MALLGLCLAGRAAAAPLEAYGRLPYIETAAISPDGSRLGLILTEGEVRKIAIEDLRTGKRQLLNAGDTKVRDIQWAGPDHLLITMSTAEEPEYVDAADSEWAYTFDYNVTDGRLRQLLRDARGGMSIIAESPEIRVIDGKTRVFVEGIYFAGGRGVLSLYEIDLSNIRSDLIVEGLPSTVDWVVGPDGEPLAQSGYEVDRQQWTLRLKAKTGWRSAKQVSAGTEAPQVLGLGRSPRSLLVGEMKDGEYQVQEFAVDDGSWTSPFTDVAESTPIRDPQNGLLVGFSDIIGEERRMTFLDEQLKRSWAAIQKIYPGQRLSLVSWTYDKTKFVVYADSPTDGPAYALVDLKAKEARWLGATFQGLQASDIGPVRAITFRAEDGLPLSGYLTLPHGVTPTNLPLIVLPHGGPAARDDPGFDWWAQAMASRGYAVLQVNYRGSDGFGWDFMSAGFGQWGRKMQTDLSDGVRYLASEGIVDPKRVCIVGASYGGYAALAGATIDKGNYRCAAAVAGLSDLKRFVLWSREERRKRAARYWLRFMGAEGVKDPALAEISPALNLDGPTVPILLVHGRDDSVVPIEQSLIMQRALKAKGRPVEFVELKGEDHWLSRSDTRLQMLKSVVEFVERHNPPH